MKAAWNEYQEEAAEFFRSLGLEATTNTKINGVRTSHDIDVLVKSRHAGFVVTWLVECKYWETRVTKLHVLGLREIVADTGADRGILLAEKGFQSGAFEAAALTNVHLTSLSQARGEARAEIFGMRFAELYDRLEKCRERYWDIPKQTRIEYGLRTDVGQNEYSGANVIELVENILRKAFRGVYPFEIDSLIGLVLLGARSFVNSAEEAILLIEPRIQELESKLDSYATTANVSTKN